ncbi:DUF3267 domain-containing protein [Halalkalibacter nanhaiisediminis]|uniref:Putative zincin peptidase n=1 Tax=Halalkalibacter nanhaiisediminis TaxID=688079 RepID=A0A562QHR8_9BACI|nr:DUF3267 domain-containing protein [Halalkalibacter nanhaiisediminis]TWI56213.1 putative zincin peptidase [Halalkalibacter nanhaiisediminis]
MNCWKTIRITHDYGSLRLMMYSGCTMLFSFLFYYLVVSTLVKTPELTNIGFFFFIGSIIFLVIIHQALHIIPIWLCGNKAKVKLKWNSFIPTLTVKITKPLSRNLYLTALLMPFLVITVVGAIASVLFPMYIAYISIMSSIHFGLVFYDLVYVSYLLKAPKKCFVETHAEGFHILIKQAM